MENEEFIKKDKFKELDEILNTESVKRNYPVYQYCDVLDRNYKKQKEELMELIMILSHKNYIRPNMPETEENQKLYWQYEKLLTEKDIDFVKAKVYHLKKLIESEECLLQMLVEGKNALDNDDISKYKEIWNEENIKRKIFEDSLSILNE